MGSAPFSSRVFRNERAYNQANPFAGPQILWIHNARAPSLNWSAMSIRIAPREKIALLTGGFLSVLLLLASLSGRVELSWSEVLGFVTGAGCVYLTVKRHVWNFPIGLANNVFFGILFFESRLYNDFGLQIVYFALGGWGWWFWTRRSTKNEGENSQEEILQVGRAGAFQIGLCVFAVPVLTLVLTFISRQLGGAAPFFDALTTALSLVAQYLLGRKWIENWAFWIAADLIYVPLYFSRGLFLTGALYAGFISLCLWGFRGWKTSWEEQRRA